MTSVEIHIYYENFTSFKVLSAWNITTISWVVRHIGGKAWVNLSKFSRPSMKQVKVRNNAGGFCVTLLNTEIWGSAHGLKWSESSLTEVYTEPNFVCSRFLCAVIGYCSTVLLSTSAKIQTFLSPWDAIWLKPVRVALQSLKWVYSELK